MGAVEIQADVIPFGDAADEMPRSPGEPCDVGVLLAELADAESLGAGRSAPELGVLLETFFDTVAEVASAHAGYVERHDLCAVACVFGAPASCTAAADAALAAGRELRDRLVQELPGVAFGIGISVVASVAGWIDASRRFEPLMICAPVTEAWRLSERGARDGSPLLASGRALARASLSEAARWSPAAPTALEWAA